MDFSLNAFHTDGPGVAKHIDSILTAENTPIIQWAQGMGQDLPIMQWVPLIEKVQAAGKSVIVDVQPHELDEFMSKADPTGILIWIAAEPEYQRDVLKKLEAW